jgi:hypothetical protein
MSCYRGLLQGTTKVRSENATEKIMDHTLEDAEESKKSLESHGLKRINKGKVVSKKIQLQI